MQYSPAWNHLLSIAFITLICGALAAQNEDTLLLRDAKPGDFCIRCGTDHQHIEKVVMNRGRWIAVCENCESFVLANHDSLAHYTEKLQPKGALFQESAVQSEDNPIRWGWFAAGIWVLFALLSAAAASVIGLRKGLSPKRWFFIGLIFSIGGVIAALANKTEGQITLPDGMAKVPTTRTPIACPKCSNLNHPSSTQCSNCGIQLTAEVESEVQLINRDQ